MARETIASVKKAATLKLRQQGNAFALKLDVKEREHTDLIKVRDDHISSLIRRNTEATSKVAAAERELRSQMDRASERIDELFRSNNQYQQEARDARAMVARLQDNLSDAARMIATLGERPAFATERPRG